MPLFSLLEKEKFDILKENLKEFKAIFTLNFEYFFGVSLIFLKWIKWKRGGGLKKTNKINMGVHMKLLLIQLIYIFTASYAKIYDYQPQQVHIAFGGSNFYFRW